MTKQMKKDLLLIEVGKANVNAIPVISFFSRLLQGDENAWACKPDYMPEKEFYYESFYDAFYALNKDEQMLYKTIIKMFNKNQITFAAAKRLINIKFI